MLPLPVVLWGDKLGVQPFRKRELRAMCIEVMVSTLGPQDLIFLPSGVDAQDAWREIILPDLLQLEKGNLLLALL